MSARMRTTTPTRTLTTSLGSLAAVLALAAAGCTGGSESAAEETTPSPRPTAKQTPSSPPTSPSAAPPSVSPTEPSSPTETTTAAPTPSAASVQPPPAGSGPEEMLLRARDREMPGLNDEHGWRTIATDDHERRQPVWACQVTDFASIGATDVQVRRFVGEPGGAESAKARSAVVTFADDQSAQRAYAVLQAWHDRCEEQLSDHFREVDVDAAATPVEVPEGQAEWRMATYGPAEGEQDAGYFDATGYVVEGSRISLTTMVSVGQDYNYPRGEEPIVEAVRNSATKLLG
jgi:hypothetical protein